MESESKPHPFFFIDIPHPRPSGLVLKRFFCSVMTFQLNHEISNSLPDAYLSCFDSSGSGGDANEFSDHWRTKQPTNVVKNVGHETPAISKVHWDTPTIFWKKNRIYKTPLKQQNQLVTPVLATTSPSVSELFFYSRNCPFDSIELTSKAYFSQDYSPLVWIVGICRLIEFCWIFDTPSYLPYRLHKRFSSFKWKGRTWIFNQKPLTPVKIEIPINCWWGYW